jgi:hypothetical protein
MSSILESLTDGLTIGEYPDWVKFVERLKEAVRTEEVRRVPVLKPVWSKTEQWFLDPKTGVVYVYVEPDSPVLPKWEKVDVLSHLEAPDPAPLSGFKVGPITVMMAHVMRLNIETLIARGLVEPLPTPPNVPASIDGTQRWYRDRVSDVVYRLCEYYPPKGPDDIRWEVVPQSELSGKIQ